MITKKICIIGDFGVGKTSLVRRFVNNAFSDKYLTTVGVKIDTKLLEITNDQGNQKVKLVIWDIAGTDNFPTITPAYLRGSEGLLFVADGTRAYTFDNLYSIREQAIKLLGEIPSVTLLNKMDLVNEWEVTDEKVDEFSKVAGDVLKTSAKTGLHVEQAFQTLASNILGNLK